MGALMKVLHFFALLGIVVYPAFSQTQPSSLITQKIDSSRLVALQGSVHPLAQARYDKGAVPDSLSAERMILLLNRPPEQEVLLKQYLESVHTMGSPSYHQWLTPEQFGAQFGPRDADLQTVVGWLVSQGFQIDRTSAGRQLIEFSGTTGNLRAAFHTEIHEYAVNGATHYANATELKIPAALAQIIKGVTPLNDFRAEPLVKVVGKAQIGRGQRSAPPQWTAPNQYGTSNPYEYTVVPEDFATQYNLDPLYQVGINGAGQTIGIINESNINLSLVQAYQNLFGIAGTTPQVIIDGVDPGDLSGVDVEAYLDVEMASAVAPKATVNLYIASAGYLVDPLELAAFRAVEDNRASVLSVSFGQCEQYLGNAGNQFWAALWEQAAAQGQTVLVSSGDTGSECALEKVNTVSGLASTPWNVAVGGTDFYYSDYANSGTSATSLWNAANDNNLGSLKAPLPEQAWDDAYGFNIIADGYQRQEIYAGGGGASNCSSVDASTNVCAGGYAKPSWQSGDGVPADGVRDIPDISLFASNGANLSAYAICAYEGECASGSGASAEVVLVGGTSASAPAMAGIMALLNQKYGRQGQAAFTLYPLALQKPTVFHDITVGSNSEVCGGQPNPPICVLQWNGIYGTSQYPAGAGYDLATGLGSVDASALINNWSSIAFRPTTTSIRLSKSTVVHGTPVSVTASVSAASGSGAPTGDVAILTDSSLPASQSQLLIPLSNGSGAASDINYLPGGSYDITGHYGGDAVFASSTSQPVELTVTPEASNINFTVLSGFQTLVSGGIVNYNAPLQLNVQPTGVSAAAGRTDGFATGSAVFAVDTTKGTAALNSAGIAVWSPPALSVGTHTASASYGGDASFKASSSAAFPFTVAKGIPYRNMNLLAPQSTTLPEFDVLPGGNFTVEAEVGPQIGALTGGSPLAGTVGPTGTVTVCLNANANVGGTPCTNPSYVQTVPLSAANGIYGLYSSAVVTFSNLAAGSYMPQFQYNGDANWQASGLYAITWVVVQPYTPLAATSTSLTITPDTISGTQTAHLSTTVAATGNASAAPTGTVSYYDDGHFLAYQLLAPSSTAATSSAAFDLGPSAFWNSGDNQITVIYSGDANYASSTSNVASITANQTIAGDFTLAPQAPQADVTRGNSATIGLSLTSISSFDGTVNLTCVSSSTQFSCSVSPAAVALNGAATTNITVTAMQQSAGITLQTGKSNWPLFVAMCGFCFFFVRGRTRQATICGAALLAVLSVSSCGGSSTTQSNQPPAGSTPVGTYSMVITGTANRIVHNAKLLVIVH
jgi:hypothetical protein